MNVRRRAIHFAVSLVRPFDRRGENVRNRLLSELVEAVLIEVAVTDGERLANEGDGGLVSFAYRGLDGVTRRTFVAMSPPMNVISFAPDGPTVFELDWNVAPGASESLSVTVWTDTEIAAEDGDEVTPPPIVGADQPQAMHRAWRQSSGVTGTTSV